MHEPQPSRIITLSSTSAILCCMSIRSNSLLKFLISDSYSATYASRGNSFLNHRISGSASSVCGSNSPRSSATATALHLHAKAAALDEPWIFSTSSSRRASASFAMAPVLLQQLQQRQSQYVCSSTCDSVATKTATTFQPHKSRCSIGTLQKFQQHQHRYQHHPFMSIG
jgi:hypothetical protein